MRERITIDLNRVEGDLEVRLDVEDNVVRDSWCVGTMYRGYEQGTEATSKFWSAARRQMCWSLSRAFAASVAQLSSTPG